MEEDILDFPPIVMFRGTPCRISQFLGTHKKYFKFSVWIMRLMENICTMMLPTQILFKSIKFIKPFLEKKLIKLIVFKFKGNTLKVMWSKHYITLCIKWNVILKLIIFFRGKGRTCFVPGTSRADNFRIVVIEIKAWSSLFLNIETNLILN